MTRFLDGPAQGKMLMLKRAPFFLRVVIENDKVDALDQLGDTPELTESIHVYQAEGEPGTIHINTRGKPGGGFFTLVNYRLCPTQPTDTEARDATKWPQWCELHGNEWRERNK